MLNTIQLPTANGLFSELIRENLVRPFFLNNIGYSVSYLVTFNVNPVVGKKLYLDNIPFAHKLRGVNVVTSTNQPTINQSGTTYNVPTADSYKGATLNLVNHKKQILAVLPLAELARLSDTGKMQFLNMDLDLKSSYVQFLDDAQGLDTSDAFLINLYY